MKFYKWQKQTFPRTIYSWPVRIHFLCAMDPDSGFCSQTRTYHNLRQTIHDLPPPSQPLSITEYVFSLLHRYRSSSTTDISTTVSDPTTFMINDATGHRLTYSDLLLQTNSLAISLSFLKPRHLPFVQESKNYLEVCSLSLTVGYLGRKK